MSRKDTTQRNAQIRRMAASGDYTIDDLMAEFGLSRSSVSGIAAGCFPNSTKPRPTIARERKPVNPMERLGMEYVDYKKGG